MYVNKYIKLCEPWQPKRSGQPGQTHVETEKYCRVRDKRPSPLSAMLKGAHLTKA